MYEKLDGCRGDLNKWEVACQVLESNMIKALIGDRGKVEKLRNEVQKLDQEDRMVKICKIFEKFVELTSCLVRPTQQKFAEEMIFVLTNNYGAELGGFGLGVGLGIEDIKFGDKEELDRIENLVEKVQKCQFGTAARTLADLGDRPLSDRHLGAIWTAVADCRNLQRSLDPRDLDSGFLGSKYVININWKMCWTEEGLYPQSEELPFKAEECIYDGQKKFDA